MAHLFFSFPYPLLQVNLASIYPRYVTIGLELLKATLCFHLPIFITFFLLVFLLAGFAEKISSYLLFIALSYFLEKLKGQKLLFGTGVGFLRWRSEAMI